MCSALKASSKMLKSILKRSGNQCKEAKTGVMRSHLVVKDEELMLEFCLVSLFDGNRRCDEMKPCVTVSVSFKNKHLLNLCSVSKLI